MPHLRTLAALLPSDRLLWEEAERATFAGDKWASGPLPDVVARPRTTEEVATIARFCFENDVPLTTRGAGWAKADGARQNCPALT